MLQWHPTPVLLPGESHGQRSLVGCSPWGRYESDMTERLHFHFSLSCIGEGNGNPLQYSCLENPRDGGAWWAAVSGVTQSQTRLKRLSSSSSSSSSSNWCWGHLRGSFALRSSACAGEIRRAWGWNRWGSLASPPLYSLSIWSLQNDTYKQPDLLDGGWRSYKKLSQEIT